MSPAVEYIAPYIGGSFALGLVFLAVARLAERQDKPTPEAPKPLTLPGPHGMESRLDYAHLGRVVEAKRMVEREG